VEKLQTSLCDQPVKQVSILVIQLIESVYYLIRIGKWTGVPICFLNFNVRFAALVHSAVHIGDEQ